MTTEEFMKRREGMGLTQFQLAAVLGVPVRKVAELEAATGSVPHLYDHAIENVGYICGSSIDGHFEEYVACCVNECKPNSYS